MEWLENNFSIVVTVLGWIYMIGVYVSKIKQHDKELEDIKKRQDNIDAVLMSINNNLTALSTKVDLLISDRIKINSLDKERK